MLRLIQESRTAALNIASLCASTYDARVEYSVDSYLSNKEIIDENLPLIDEMLLNLEDVYTSAKVDPVLESEIYPSRSAEFTSIKLPLPSAELNILTPQAHYFLDELTKSFIFDASAGSISGVSVYSVGGVEASSRFILSTEQQDYGDAGIHIDWSAGVFTVSESVRCITLDNNAPARKSGLLQNLSGRPLAYRTVSEVAYILAAEPTVLDYIDEISVQGGVLEGRADLVGSVVLIEGSSYVIEEGGKMCTFVASTPASDLSGTYQANIRVYTVDAVGQVSVLGEVDATANYSSVDLSTVSAKRGDYLVSAGDIVGVIREAGEGARAEMLPGYSGEAISIVAETYTRLGDFISELPLREYQSLLDKVESRQEFTYTAETCNKINSILDSLESSAKGLTCPSNVSRVWSDLTTLHTRAGLDRASDILSEARINQYLSLGSEEGSYASLLSSVSEDLIVEVQK